MLRGGGIELRSPASQLAVAVLARPAHAYENLGHSLTHSPVAVLLRKDRRLSLLKAGFAVYTTRHIVFSLPRMAMCWPTSLPLKRLPV